MNNFDLKRLFVIDAISSALIVIIIIGIIYQIPTPVNVLLQMIFISIILMQLYFFLRRGIFGMAIIKILMLIILLIIDLHA